MKTAVPPVCWVIAGLMLSSPARADDAPPPDKSGFTVFNPTPTEDLRSLCADRPSKATGPCTVDAGHWQVESDLYNVTLQTADGITTRTELFTNPTVKIGLTNTLDFEVNWAPWEQVTTHDAATGRTAIAAGVGDLFLKAKWNLIGDDGGGDVSLAVLPYVKLPTAPSTLGNGEVEGGVLALLQLSLPAKWQLSIDPEADILANASGSGFHLNASSVVSFSYPATKSVTLAFEIWGQENFDPSGTIAQSSFDLAAAWIPPKAPNVQLDTGINLGLTKATPGAQLYVGVTRRF